MGLIITLAAVVACSGYITWQISGLRELQNNLVDRNRKDSLQLLRIQNDLDSLALAMRDMLDNNEPYPLTAWSAQFQRIRADLDDALRKEEQVAVADRTPEQRQYLGNSMAQFWDAVDRTFALAANGKPDEARSQIQLSLQARQAALSTAVARLLVQNNESEEQAALRIGQIYDRVQRQVYLFLALTLVAILLTGLYSIRSNRLLFAQLAALSAQRSDLAQKLISTRRVRTDSDRGRRHAGPRRKPGAGGFAVARRVARSCRNRANYFGQGAQPVAGAASRDARRNRTGEHARLVFAGGGTAGGHSHIL